MAGRDPPYFVNTEEDRGAIVAVVTFTFAIVATITNSIRVWIRQRIDGALGLDDALLVGANVIAILQSILVGASVKRGLGRHFNTLSDVSIAQYYKFSYASSILAILSMSLAKFSVLHLQRRLCGTDSTDRYIKVMYFVLSGSISIWAVFSVFALAFQCGTTRPEYYQPDRCADGVLWFPVTISNAITDAALAFSFTPIILKLNARTQMKVRVLCLLGSRILVCMATVVQIVSLARGLTAADQTRAMIEPVVTQQIVMNLSILTAVVLSLHGFFANMTAGRFGVEVRETGQELSQASYNKAKGSAGSNKARSWAKNAPHHGSGHSTHDRADSQLRVRENGSRTPGLRPDLVSKGKAWARHEEENEWEDRRSDGSQENIIRQTVTWQVSRNAPSVSREEDELQTLPTSSEQRETRARNFLT